jgi:hypothetical protein
MRFYRDPRKMEIGAGKSGKLGQSVALEAI